MAESAYSRKNSFSWFDRYCTHTLLIATVIIWHLLYVEQPQSEKRGHSLQNQFDLVSKLCKGVFLNDDEHKQSYRIKYGTQTNMGTKRPP